MVLQLIVFGVVEWWEVWIVKCGGEGVFGDIFYQWMVGFQCVNVVVQVVVDMQGDEVGFEFGQLSFVVIGVNFGRRMVVEFVMNGVFCQVF